MSTMPDVGQLTDLGLEERLGREHRQATVLKRRADAAGLLAHQAKQRWTETRNEITRRKAAADSEKLSTGIWQIEEAQRHEPNQRDEEE